MTDDSQVPTAPGIGLLVSVRSAEEAARALAGGASLIDVKEPLHGSLGRADDTVIEAVLRTVGDVRPVSAALGEWAETSSAIPPLALTFVKWGLAGCQHRNDWRQRLVPLRKTQRQPQVVLAAYADWQCAQAPPVEDVFALAKEHPGSVLLIDTYCKETSSISQHRPTLLDWLPAAWVEDLCDRCRVAGGGRPPGGDGKPGSPAGAPDLVCRARRCVRRGRPPRKRADGEGPPSRPTSPQGVTALPYPLPILQSSKSIFANSFFWKYAFLSNQ